MLFCSKIIIIKYFFSILFFNNFLFYFILFYFILFYFSHAKKVIFF